MQAELKTDAGDIIIDLFADKAPSTIESFISYVNKDHYNGTIFHRIIEGFMIQGGGLDKNIKNKSTQAPIRNEANNGLSNLLGTVAMARTTDPHSATAQFYINTNDNPFLDFKSETDDGWGYCVFGKVIEGMDVVCLIEKAPTTTRDGYQDFPEQFIAINQVVLS